MKKIVVTANDDRRLDGAMAMHFGHCTHFVVVEVDPDNRVAASEVHPNPFATHHEPGQVPQYIGSLGADVVVAGGMGSKAIEWFRQVGIEVATGARSSVAETLDAYLAGAVAGAAQCHHEHGAMINRTDPEVRALAEALDDECRARATYGAGGVGGRHRWKRASGRGSLTTS